MAGMHNLPLVTRLGQSDGRFMLWRR
jgi:hypothetical protein